MFDPNTDGKLLRDLHAALPQIRDTAARVAELEAFKEQLIARSRQANDPPQVAALKLVGDLHSFMSTVKDKVSAAFVKLGV